MESSTELLTVQGASTLFGRSDQAVRMAARNGRVDTRLYLEGLTSATGQRTRLITLESALNYWNRPKFYEHTLEEMRSWSIFIEADTIQYRILHPNSLISYSE